MATPLVRRMDAGRWCRTIAGRTDDVRARARDVKRVVEFPHAPVPHRGDGGGARRRGASRACAGPRPFRQTAIVTAAARVAPAVVSVNVLRRERQMATDPFDLFFMPRGYERTVEGYGSGFVVSPDGVVITNQHVTQGAEQIVITTRDGRDFPAKRLGEDPLTDIAVLKVDGSNLPTAPIGTSTDLMTGEWVVAIGNPFAYLLGNSERT